jgi:phospholipid transport system substrate-binding protein
MTDRKTILTYIAFFFIVLATSSLVWAESQSPGKIIVQTIDEGLAILKDPALQSFDKMPERRQRLWEAVKKVFDFEETAKRALGRHWNDRSPEEQREFAETFKNILKNIYLEKSDSYAQENIFYLSETVDRNRSKVHTYFTTSDGKQIDVDFSMKIIGDEWKIYDVIVEGVSIVGNYRSQFNSILSKSTFAELMDKLREKESEVVKLEN